MSVQGYPLVQPFTESGPETIAKMPEMLCCLGQRPLSQDAGHAQSDNIGHIFRAGAAAGFVTGSVDERLQVHSLPHVERPYALRCIDLVTGHGEQIDCQFIYIHRHFADRLGSVCMNEDTALACDGRNLTNRLQCADLVVGVHDADDPSTAVESLADRIRVDRAEAIDRQDRNPATEALQEFARTQGSGMLDGTGNDVGSLQPAPEDAAQLGEDYSLERE